MDLFPHILTITGLCLFETITSIDNAIINAEVLSTMGEKARKWFLLWGILIAVFLVRGLLPWFIVWMTLPDLGPIGALTATFQSDPEVHLAIETAKPVLLAGGGTFLIFLFFHWLFLEPKNYGMFGERFLQSQGIWFFAIVSVLLSVIVYLAVNSEDLNPNLAFGAVVGSTAFFITHGFKENAAKMESELMKEGLSDTSKILYLEVIDATFSIDGVLGAFAFTMSIPLILIGNGLDAFGAHIPHWVSPVITFVVVAYFFWLSVRDLKSGTPVKMEAGAAGEEKVDPPTGGLPGAGRGTE